MGLNLLSIGKQWLVVRIQPGEQIFKLALKMWKLYILYCNNKHFYTGITTNLNNRLKQHRNKQSKFTKCFNKIVLVYTEKFKNKKDAAAREKEVKGWNKRKKIKLINGLN